MAKVVRDAFSQAEYEKNLARGAECWIPVCNLEPYDGPFKEIDLTLDWYCPRCRQEACKLILSKDKASLYCPTRWEECEYSYSNAAIRDAREIFLSSGYEWPLSLKELLAFSIGRKRQFIKATKRHIKDLRLGIKDSESEIITLQARFEAIDG